jgi:DNA-binding transcriptional ArsR family regulator
VIPVEPLDLPVGPTGTFADDELDVGEERTHAVRPYAITGGRTRAGGRPHLPVEALVQGLADPGAIATTPERRRILELTRDEYLSVAELSAHLEVPVGVVRVLLGDLADDGLVRVHGVSSSAAPAMSLSVLESVLNGISSL